MEAAIRQINFTSFNIIIIQFLFLRNFVQYSSTFTYLLLSSILPPISHPQHIFSTHQTLSQLPMFTCKYSNKGCCHFNYTSYSLQKHQDKCTYRTITAPSQPPQQQPSPLQNTSSPPSSSPPSPHLPSPTPNIPSTDTTPSLSNTESILLVQSLAISLCTVERHTGTKLTDEIISILNNPLFSLSRFRNDIQSTAQCKLLVSSIVDEHLSSNGYQTKSISDSSGTSSGLLYFRNPIDVLRQQLALANKDNSFFRCVKRTNHQGERIFSHPLHTSFAQELETYIAQQVMAHPEDDVTWNNTSFVGFLQLFSDKSSTTLKASAIVAYPIHLTFLNFSLPLRQHCIRNGLSIIGYLPVSSLPTHPSEISDSLPATSGTSLRNSRLSILHNSIQDILTPLSSITTTGFHCTDSNNTNKKCFPVLTSYCADFPEAKELAAIVAGAKTTRPCHRCYAHYKHLSRSSPAPLRRLYKTAQIRKKYNSLQAKAIHNFNRNAPTRARQLRSEALSLLSTHSIQKHPSFLETSPLIPPNAPIDMYDIYTYEPLHNLWLGVSKLILICISLRLLSKTLTTTTGSSTNSPRPFASIRHKVLRGVNNILAAIERDYPAPGLHIDFSTSSAGSSLNGIFVQDGLRGMLEAKDYRALTMVFPFIGAFIDFCCDETDTCPITTICTQYADIVRWLYGNHSPPDWSESLLQALHQNIISFMNYTTEIFESHQTSGLNIPKFHLLTHLVDDLRRMGGIHHMDVGAYENAHLIFKQNYARTSKRRANAMEETIRRIQQTTDLDQIKVSLNTQQSSSQGTLTTQNSPFLSAFRQGAKLVRDGFSFTLQQFINASNAAAPIVQNIEGQPSPHLLHHLREFHNSNAIDLFLQLGDQASFAFIDLTRDELQRIKSSAIPKYTRITIVKSAYVIGGFLPQYSNYNDTRNGLTYLHPSIKTKQRIFATKSFGSSKKPRFSFVTMQAPSTHHGDVWVGKVLALVRIKPSDQDDPIEFIFLQYMDIIPPENNIDETLGCISLQWSSAEEVDRSHPQYTISRMKKQPSNSIPGPWYGLVECSSILSTLHVLRKNFPVTPFFQETHWLRHKFYINRFYIDPTSKQVEPDSDSDNEHS